MLTEGATLKQGLSIHRDGSVVGHAFTAAGLGSAPFTFIGMRENVFDNGDGTTKGGGTCAYCGTGIRNEFVVRSACGNQFVVGCDCIRKVNDTRLIAAIASAERLHNRKVAQARKEKKQAENANTCEALQGDFEAALVVLSAKPHPHPFLASQGKTLADYYRYVTTGTNATNRLGYIRTAIKSAEGK